MGICALRANCSSAVCVLQRVAVCCSALQCVAVRCRILSRCAQTSRLRYVHCSLLQCGAMCCIALQCAAVQCVAGHWRVAHELLVHGMRVVQCVLVCCRVLQYVAVCCKALACCARIGSLWNVCVQSVAVQCTCDFTHSHVR